MAADSWTISSGDATTITVTVTISDVARPLKVAIEQLGTGNQASKLVALRAVLNDYRTAVLAGVAIPASVQSVIGYSEPF